jgi:aldose 1-epimerase
MFSIVYITPSKGNGNYFHIYNAKVSAKIYPELGASIQELIWNNTPIIQGFQNSKTLYMEHYHSALLFPFAGRIDAGKYQFQSQEFQLDLNDIHYQNALHGLVYDKHFKCTHKAATSTDASIVFEYSSSGHLHGFPFKFCLEVHYHFSEEGMQLAVKVNNIGTKTFPFCLGWHPYFITKSINQDTIEIHSNKAYATNERLIPTVITSFNPQNLQPIGTQHLDTSYRLAAPFIYYKSEDYELILKLKNQVNSFLQLYTPEDRKSIAIEPLTALPNAFNNKQGLQILKPNNTYQCQWHLNIKTYD